MTFTETRTMPAAGAQCTCHPSSLPLRAAYAVVLLAAMLPFGTADTGWLSLVIGGVGLGLVPSFGPLAACVLGVYRLVQIARQSQILACPRSVGFVRVLRYGGIVLLYAGALTALVCWVANLVMLLPLKSRTDAGVEFYTELYLYLAAGVGVLGLAVFEFSRLLAFERCARQPSPIRRDN